MSAKSPRDRAILGALEAFQKSDVALADAVRAGYPPGTIVSVKRTRPGRIYYTEYEIIGEPQVGYHRGDVWARNTKTGNSSRISITGELRYGEIKIIREAA